MKFVPSPNFIRSNPGCNVPCPSYRSAQMAPPHRAAFTLIELLVVITIIAILVGLLFPVTGAVMRQARNTEALTQAQSIATAIRAYYTDYGRFPIDSATSDVVIDDEDDLSDLYKVLIASPRNDPAVQELNPRLQVFLEAKDARNGRSGLNDDYVYLDPWGEPFVVVIDANYDNEITSLPAPFASDFNATRPLRQPVAVFSEGDPDDNRAVAADKAITTWR